jgi:SAM-dependent methyltransferase
LSYLACPACHGALEITAASGSVAGSVDSGRLLCQGCSEVYAISGGIPRFVPRENYASSFGLEWTLHAKTQYDSYSRRPVSENRFFGETGWGRDLAGELILEAGSGSGRFTEQALKTGAMVVSFDYSCAVEANLESNGHNENLLIVQADINAMPFPRRMFDKLFCFGVLQHTPDPRRSFLSLVAALKPGGNLVADVYAIETTSKLLSTYYLLRPFTRRMAPAKLYRFTHRWVDALWPLATLLRRIPVVGYRINWRLMVPDYTPYALEPEILKEWAYLDCFDALGPRYDRPQTLRAVEAWCAEAGLWDVEVKRGYNGIEMHGSAPE